MNLNFDKYLIHLECIEYKLFLLGDGGAGKSAVTAWLAGISAWNRSNMFCFVNLNI